MNVSGQKNPKAFKICSATWQTQDCMTAGGGTYVYVVLGAADQSSPGSELVLVVSKPTSDVLNHLSRCQLFSFVMLVIKGDLDQRPTWPQLVIS